MGWATRRVERDMRTRGIASPTEPLAGAYAVELRSTDGGRTILARDGRMAFRGMRLPVGKPVALAFTARQVALGAPPPIGWVTDVGAVAVARSIDAYDMDLLLVAEPPRQYRLRFSSKEAAAEAAQRLTDLCRERLDALPDEERLWWLIKHADALHEVGEPQPAGELYRRVAQAGVQPHASTAAMNYGIYLKRAGSVDEARDYFHRALEAGTANVAGQSAMLLGYDALKRGDDARARDYFTRAEALGDLRAAKTIELMDQAAQGQ